MKSRIILCHCDLHPCDLFLQFILPFRDQNNGKKTNGVIQCDQACEPIANDDDGDKASRLPVKNNDDNEEQKKKTGSICRHLPQARERHRADEINTKHRGRWIGR